MDKLPPEVGDQIGPEPTLYSNLTISTLTIIAKSSVVGSRLVSALKSAQEERSNEDEIANNEDLEVSSFGAERVILVRNEEIQHELQEEVKESALVLTILQSKGMEFEDVFLYDFFSTSPYGSDFRVLEELLVKHHSSGMAFSTIASFFSINSPQFRPQSDRSIDGH